MSRKKMQTAEMWNNVRTNLSNCAGIAFDGCHKIYVLMDKKQLALMRKYEYERVLSSKHFSREDLLHTVIAWYGESCLLRFISAIETGKSEELNFYSINSTGFRRGGPICVRFWSLTFLSKSQAIVLTRKKCKSSKS